MSRKLTTSGFFLRSRASRREADRASIDRRRGRVIRVIIVTARQRYAVAPCRNVQVDGGQPPVLLSFLCVERHLSNRNAIEISPTRS